MLAQDGLRLDADALDYVIIGRYFVTVLGVGFAALIAGVNLYALAIVMQALLGWPLWVSIVVGAAIVLAYVTLGGLTSAIYNEVPRRRACTSTCRPAPACCRSA